MRRQIGFHTISFVSLRIRVSDVPFNLLSTQNANSIVEEFRPVIKKALRRVWYPTLSWLRDLKTVRTRPRSRPYTPEMESSWNYAITTWESAGRHLGLSENDPSIRNQHMYPLDSEQHTTSQSGWSPRSCGWRECPCYESPVHRMRVCKGCWRTHYCSARCQTR